MKLVLRRRSYSLTVLVLSFFCRRERVAFNPTRSRPLALRWPSDDMPTPPPPGSGHASTARIRTSSRNVRPPARESGGGALIGGISFHVNTASADISSRFGKGDIDTTGYGFDGTLTWYGKSAFDVDTQAAVTSYDSDLKSSTLQTSLADGLGYRFASCPFHSSRSCPPQPDPARFPGEEPSRDPEPEEGISRTSSHCPT